MDLQTIAEQLNLVDEELRAGFEFECQMIPGDEQVLQVALQGREEIPVYITMSDTQILCISYLWGEDEIDPQVRTAMMETMLEMNIPMPLSSFSKIGDKYTVFGALSLNSEIADVAHEIVILSDNTLDAIEVLSEYLQ